jgi:hypothetical protein
LSEFHQIQQLFHPSHFLDPAASLLSARDVPQGDGVQIHAPEGVRVGHKAVVLDVDLVHVVSIVFQKLLASRTGSVVCNTRQDVYGQVWR